MRRKGQCRGSCPLKAYSMHQKKRPNPFPNTLPQKPHSQRELKKIKGRKDTNTLWHLISPQYPSSDFLLNSTKFTRKVLKLHTHTQPFNHPHDLFFSTSMMPLPLQLQTLLTFTKNAITQQTLHLTRKCPERNVQTNHKAPSDITPPHPPESC